MKRLICVVACAAVMLGSQVRQAGAVPVFGGELDIAATIGTGPDASYILIDFGGDPPRPGTPQGAYAFEFLYDDAVDTTVGDALDQLIAGGVITAQLNSTFAASFGRFPEGFTYLNTDSQLEDKILTVSETDFATGGFFWHAADRYSAIDGTWQVADFGIDAISGGSPVDRAANPDAYLTDRSFYGFVVRNFLTGTTFDPRVPLAAATDATGAPEPSAILLVVFAMMTLAWRRPQRGG